MECGLVQDELIPIWDQISPSSSSFTARTLSRWHRQKDLDLVRGPLAAPETWMGQMKRTNFPHVTSKVPLPLTPRSVIFLSARIKHLNVSLGKTLSCPPFVIRNSRAELLSWCYDNAWTTRWYTKLVLTTGSLVDSLPSDHGFTIQHTSHRTPHPLVRVGGGERSKGGRGRRGGGDGRLSDSWKMCVAKKFIKHCRFPWHVHLLASPRGTPL